MGALTLSLPARAADLIYACVNNSSGTIKIVAQTDVCPNGALKTSLSTVAPTPPPDPPPTDVIAEENHPTISFPSGGHDVVAELLNLPPGKYLLIAHISSIYSYPTDTTSLTYVACALNRGSGPPAQITYGELYGSSAGMSLTGTVTLDTEDDISVTCTGTASGQIRVAGAQLFAHAVANIVDGGR
jgi:hypothetical protein